MNKSKKSGIGMLVLVIFFIYFSITLVEQQKILSEKEVQRNKVEDKIAEEEKIKKDLEKQKSSLGSDESIEKTARERLGMVKAGERIYIDAGK